ncbi:MULTISPECIES: hypothetical protein [unclassified Micromonospora]|uniref:hypothetical protein n=1 Tax=unclassified Micromonospora TaxID=2617518 RepID=UPI0022B62D4F|nr:MULTISPECIES: hypothetical protein [unclassified Micromonospora]MCZ7418254.1 hypothetical protein [Verrucosispora sp. WMMA2121]WBB91987.1 hypothetical protein O7597_02840 [Verrucosispora sp. WMMC514]
MNRIRASFSVLACASLLALAACSGEEAAPTAASPSATLPSATATTASPTPAAPTADAADVVSDKQLCQSAKQASDKMREDLIAAVSSGSEPSPALFQKILSGLQNEMTRVAATGATDSKVVAALEEFGAEAGDAANATDPATAADNPAFEKAGASLSKACKSAGVTVTF